MGEKSAAVYAFGGGVRLMRSFVQRGLLWTARTGTAVYPATLLARAQEFEPDADGEVGAPEREA
jgi:hypothetical protein